MRANLGCSLANARFAGKPAPTANHDSILPDPRFSILADARFSILVDARFFILVDARFSILAGARFAGKPTSYIDRPSRPRVSWKLVMPLP